MQGSWHTKAMAPAFLRQGSRLLAARAPAFFNAGKPAAMYGEKGEREPWSVYCTQENLFMLLYLSLPPSFSRFSWSKSHPHLNVVTR